MFSAGMKRTPSAVAKSSDSRPLKKRKQGGWRQTVDIESDSNEGEERQTNTSTKGKGSCSQSSPFGSEFVSMPLEDNGPLFVDQQQELSDDQLTSGGTHGRPWAVGDVPSFDQASLYVHKELLSQI